LRTTIVDIAKRVGLTHATVSRVLNGRTDNYISDATRKRVIEAAGEMGYVPNRAARALATGRTGVIGLWVGGMTAFQTLVADSVQRILEAEKLEMLISNLGFFYGTRIRADRAAGWPVDGVLALDSGASGLREWLAARASYAPPIVSMGFYYETHVDHVGFDITLGLRKTVEHLTKQGRRRIASFASSDADVTTDSFLGSLRSVLAEIGVELELIVVDLAPGEDIRAASRRAVVKHVGEFGAPEGIVSVSDSHAVGAHRGLKDLGLRMPEDVALFGCDGVPDGEYLDPPLSTICYPVPRMCEMAWSFLKNRMAEPDRELQSAVLEPTLLLRGSA